ncbi:MAG TPA: glycosyltransferase family 39 protein [Gemmatimonadota bacterium]|nr:glycosyltransferase family 39 protein [Gemmatimonadota bacterium]
MDDAGWRFGAAALLILGLTLSARELGRAPLEVHEAYVVQTAQEMSQRGSWVVPWFNGQPRLKKPPLSYWATALVGRVRGHDPIEPADGRIPSALAGVGILALVLWTGRRFYGSGTALLAGVMLISSVGYFHYTHGARSDMLYAFWAMAALAAFAVSTGRAQAGRSTGGAALVMWVCFGLGTLTKGPQVPAMFLAAFAGWTALERFGWRRALETIRPFAGAAVFLALTIPWWLAMERAAGIAGVDPAQLEGSLLRPGPFSPEYLFRLPQILIPWALLLPVVVVLEWRTEGGRATRLLALVVAVTFLALSFGSQQRAFYVLPLLGPAVLLLAAGTTRALAGRVEHPRLGRWIGWTARGLALLAPCAAIGYLLLHSRVADAPADATLRVALAAALAFALCSLVFARPLEAWTGTAGILALAVLAYGSFWLLGGPALEWSRARDGAEPFGRLAAAGTPDDREILAWDAFPDPFVYYAGRPIREITEVGEVLDRLRVSPEGLVILAKTKALRELPAVVEVEVLRRQTSYRDRDLSLVRLSLRAPSLPAHTPRWARHDP